MTDPIKVLYSWIGPRGPISNTELPSILCFTMVAEQVSTTSSKFWAESNYKNYFYFNESFSLNSTFGITEKDTFIYPYALTWRVPFSSYFFPENGILEFSHTPAHITHLVAHGNGYFVIECTFEAWVLYEHLNAMHKYFEANHIPLGKIIYLTGCVNATEMYNRWCLHNGIPDTPDTRLNIISVPSARYTVLSGYYPERPDPEYDSESIPEKLFLCWNRRFRSHRTLLILSLDKLGLVDRSYYSMGKTDPEFNYQKFTESVRMNLYSNNPYLLTYQDLINLDEKLPLTIDGETQIGEMCSNNTGNATQYYEKSLISIITETNCDSEYITLTEKTFKVFKEKHPFILVGVPGSLKAVRELGFKTFNEFWDESYDEIEDFNQRLLKIISICKEIGEWDNAKILDFKRKVKPIIDYNHRYLKSGNTNEISNKIKDIVRKKNIE